MIWTFNIQSNHNHTNKVVIIYLNWLHHHSSGFIRNFQYSLTSCLFTSKRLSRARLLGPRHVINNHRTLFQPLDTRVLHVASWKLSMTMSEGWMNVSRGQREASFIIHSLDNITLWQHSLASSSVGFPYVKRWPVNR